MPRPTVAGLQQQLLEAEEARDDAKAAADLYQREATDESQRANAERVRAETAEEERNWLRSLVDRLTAAPPEADQ